LIGTKLLHSTAEACQSSHVLLPLLLLPLLLAVVAVSHKKM